MRLEKDVARIVSAENLGIPEAQVLLRIELSNVGAFWLQRLHFVTCLNSCLDFSYS